MAEEAVPDLLYGAAAVGKFLGLTEGQAKHRAAAGLIPTFKMGRQICASRVALAAWLADRVAAARKAAP